MLPRGIVQGMGRIDDDTDHVMIQPNIYGSPSAGGSGIMGALGGESSNDTPDPRLIQMAMDAQKRARGMQNVT